MTDYQLRFVILTATFAVFVVSIFYLFKIWTTLEDHKDKSRFTFISIVVKKSVISVVLFSANLYLGYEFILWYMYEVLIKAKFL